MRPTSRLKVSAPLFRSCGAASTRVVTKPRAMMAFCTRFMTILMPCVPKHCPTAGSSFKSAALSAQVNLSEALPVNAIRSILKQGVSSWGIRSTSAAFGASSLTSGFLSSCSCSTRSRCCWRNTSSLFSGGAAKLRPVTMTADSPINLMTDEVLNDRLSTSAASTRDLICISLLLVIINCLRKPRDCNTKK